MWREKPEWFGLRSPESDEIDCRGAYITLPQELHELFDTIETALEDFSRFTAIYDCSTQKSFRISLKLCPTESFEAFTIETSSDRCVIFSSSSEGFRRAIYFLEDELLRREGMLLPIGRLSRRPHLRSRITRSFFAPINRPPLNIDELMTDEDYYPDEYLSRLAHDGANGIWIYTRLSDLVVTSVFPEHGVGREAELEKRISKLSSLTERALRYGIKTYVFFI